MAELDFVAMAEEHSVVEKLLTGDPAGLYTRMDEDTRADYRRAVALKAIRQEIGGGGGGRRRGGGRCHRPGGPQEARGPLVAG